MKQVIRTPDAPSSPLFSQAIKVGSTVYVSGMAGIDPKTNQLAGSTIQEQTRQALINCQNILRAAGSPFGIRHCAAGRTGGVSVDLCGRRENRAN